MSIYLYVKTHNKTGLKYLGQTTSRDPHKYTGSGKYWKNHIKKHGYDVTTEILKECTNKEELKQLGLYYSNLWNIVESNKWANLKLETGDGGFSDSARIFTPERLLKMKNNNPMKNKSSRDKISKKLKGVPKSAEHKKNMFNPMLDKAVSSRRKGSNNPIYDHTIYSFHHLSSNITVSMTQRNFIEHYLMNKGNISSLVNGRKQIVKGWSIKEFSL